MKNMTNVFAIVLVVAVALAITIGCDSPDERLVHQLAETSQKVVQQNQEIAKTQHEIAEGSKQLVVAVAQSRHEHNQLQQSIQVQRDQLESERRSIAVQRRYESLLVPVLETTGVLLVAALPLVLCWYLLHGLRGPDEDVSEVLISHLVSQTPELLDTRNDQPEIAQRTTSPGDEKLPF